MVKEVGAFFEISKQYPLSKVLYGLFTANAKWLPRVSSRGSIKTHRQLDVVGAKLCDDVLKHIGHRLRPYEGCDIIDINPGACLWTQKLHTFLRPRTHLLLEPEKKNYIQFIKPLLEKDPTYKFSNLPPTHHSNYWKTYEQIFRDDLLPPRRGLDKDDPALRQPDRTLLLTGQLHRMYNKDGYNRASIENVVTTSFGHLVHAAQTNELVHRYGLVKMLLWIPETAKINILPWHLRARRTSSMSADLVVDINQVAGLPRNFDGSSSNARTAEKVRAHALEKISTADVLGRSVTSSKATSSTRKSEIQKETEKEIRNIHELRAELEFNLKTPSCASSPQSLEAATKVLERDSKVFASDHRALHVQKDEQLTDRARQLVESQLYFPFETPIPNRFADFMHLSRRQIEAEAAFWILHDTLPPEARTTLESRLMRTAALIRNGIYGKGTLEYRMLAERCRGELDDQRALFLSSPVLAWDRREYEPIASLPEEFYPRFPATLLEVTPRSQNFASDITSKETAARIVRGFVKAIALRRASTVYDALEAMQTEAGDDLYEAVPELRDPRYGGRLDPKDMKVWSLTRELLEKLVKAYIEWPFREIDLEVLQMGADAGGLGEDEPEDPDNSEDLEE